MVSNFEFTKIEKMLSDHAKAKRIPFSGGFELTPYCNLSCRMCYIKETAPGLALLSGKQWLEIGQQAADAGVLCLVLSGGEPLLHPDFREIYTGLKKLGLVLTINTNGTLIDEATADFLAADMPRRVNISLYGPNEECYQALCGVGDAYHRTIRAIELLQERGVPVKVNITPNTINYPYIKQIFDLCRQYNLPVEIAPYLFEPIRRSLSEKQQYRLSPRQVAEIEAMYNAVALEKKDFIFQRILCYEALNHFQESSHIVQTQPIQCRAGVSSFWVCWDGAMNACASMLKPHADILKMGFGAAWEEVKIVSDQIRVPLRCSQCSLSAFCNPCAAVSLHESGKFEEVPLTLCQTAQEYARIMANGIEKKEREANSEE